MSQQIFLNIPVKDLDKSVAFFTRLGFTFNARFTDENATCMIVSDNIFVMLLVDKYFQTFTKKAVADATKVTEALIGLSADSKEKVDEMVKKAVDAGGSVYSEPNDHGFMYQHSFADPDGHQWEIFWMDPGGIPG